MPTVRRSVNQVIKDVVISSSHIAGHNGNGNGNGNGHSKLQVFRATSGALIVNLPLADMKIDPAYQREFDKRHATSILADFSLRSVQLIRVSYRDGILWVMDGQHTRQDLLDKGFTEATCELFTGLTKKDEADIFDKSATCRKRITGWPRFKARQEAGRKDTLAIVDAMHKHGFKTPLECDESHFKKGPGGLEFAYRRKTLDAVLRIVKDAWAGDHVATSNEFFKGLVMLMSHSDIRKVPLHKVIACLKRSTPGYFLSEAAKVCTTRDGRPTQRDVFAVLWQTLYPTEDATALAA